MIINPILLSLNMMPSVASATGMYLVIFSSGASTILFIIDRLLLFEYAAYFGAASIIGTITGIKLVDIVVWRTGRQSILIFILVCLMAIALIIIPAHSGFTLKHKADTGIDILEPGQLCS